MSHTSFERMYRGPAGRATLALIGMRVAYAYNWLDIGPGLPAIGSSFGLSTADWGLLVAAFLLGAGLLQVPAGLMAARYGTRRISFIGAGLLTLGALASSLSPSFMVLLALRFAAGAGAGLFFSPAIGLVASLHPPGERGVPVGMFSSAFSAGAGLGVFATAILLPALGWRSCLALGGLLMLALAAAALPIVPKTAGPPPPTRPKAPGTWRLPAALRSKAVWGVGLAFIGLEGASLSAGQYFVPYAHVVRGWDLAIAGAVGALFVFPSVFGGPVGGRLAERSNHRRALMVLATAVPALLLAALPWVGPVEAATIACVFSFAYGMVYAMMYILPPYLPGLTSEDTPLAIGLLNALQLAGGAGVAYAVAWVAASWGYA
ncbi:MAG: MFS transporter, partial [Thermoplasmata archaeon]|nr:MFS transporter [Thermoplasmata archaeon]